MYHASDFYIGNLDKILTMEDLYGITPFFNDLDTQMQRNVFGKLGISYSNLKSMTVVADMIAAWIRKDKYVKDDPCLAGLIKALEENGHTGIASEIKKKSKSVATHTYHNSSKRLEPEINVT